MRILISGGAGFVGSHLCERLVTEGHTVFCVDNFVTGRESNVAHLLSKSTFQLIRQDVSEVFKCPGSVDEILHFASPASPPDYCRHPIETLKVGSAGTLNLLEMARAAGSKFLLASTSEVYGDPHVHPQPESYWGNVNPVGPRSVYDESKRFAEALTMAYHRTHGVDTRIVRIFNTYGPRMRAEDGRAIPNFITQALAGSPLTIYGDGSQTRSFCYVTDLTEGIRRLMGKDFHEPVNIGNPNEMRLLELAQKIIRFTKSSSHIVFKPLPVDDPKQRCPDIGRAQELFQWRPSVSLDEGIRKTVTWFSEEIPHAQR